MTFFQNPLYILLTVILAGHLLGMIRLQSFSLGPSAIIFSGLFFGLLGFSLPPVLQSLGLTLFIFAVGQQAGPGFFYTLTHGGLRLCLGALCMALMGLLTVLALGAFFDFSPSITAGLFAGSLTSTPSLAVAVEMAPHGEAPAAYGVTYLFSVVGVALMVKILPRLTRTDVRREEERMEQELSLLYPEMDFKHLRVSNPNICSRELQYALPENLHGSITRILRTNKNRPELAMPEAILHLDDIVRVVGTQTLLDQAAMLIGPCVDVDLDFNSQITKKEILLSRRDIAGKTLRSLNLEHVYGVRVSRITRNGFDCPATLNLRLRQGDLLHIVGHGEALKNVRKLLGDNVRALYVVDAMTVFIGLFCGMLIGMLPLYIPGLGIFSLGITGGALLAGLGFGALRKIGPLTTEIPIPTTIMLRDAGLALFLAVVGTKAGATFLPTLETYGLPLIFGGICTTVLTFVAGALLCRFVLNIPFLRMLGVTTGGMTSTPGLDAAAAISPSTSYAATAYATVYPAALLGKIMAAKIIMLLG